MPTHYRGSPQERQALDAYIKLMRAAESLTARLEPLMRAADLTVGQFGALEALFHLGPLCQRDLGYKLLRSGGNTTVVVGNLARRGLVRRTRRPDDRRYITVTLTDKGRRLIGGIFPRHAQHVVREMRDNPRRGMDPVVVKAFINLTGIFPVGTLVILDTLELGIVHAVNPIAEMLSRPIVRIIGDPDGNVLHPGELADLADKDEHDTYRRTIIKTEDPDRYGVRVGDYFV